MAKISLSTVFKKRRRIRYLSAASFLLLLLIFFSFLSSQNPWNARAVDVVVNGAAATATINAGKHVIASDGTVYPANNPTLPNDPYLNISNTDVTLTGASTSLAFSGGQVNLKSLTIDGASVTHLGPLANPTHMSNDYLPSEYFGAIYEGWIYPTSTLAVALHYDDAVRLYWQQDDVGTQPFGAPFSATYGGTSVTIGSVAANHWYHYKIYLKQGAGDWAIHFDGLTDGVFYKYKDLTAPHTVLAQYFQGVVNEAAQYRPDPLDDTGLGTTFTNQRILFVADDFPLTDTSPYYYFKSASRSIQAERLVSTTPIEVNLNLTGALIIRNNGNIDVSGKGYAAPVNYSNYCGEAGNGPGGGILDHACYNGGGGGGYGGKGGYGGHDGSAGASGGDPYGSRINPYELGSSGGHGQWGEAGSGGGSIQISAGLIQILSTTAIKANGADASDDGALLVGKSGGGSGGSINLKANKLDLSTITAGSNVMIAQGGVGGDDGNSFEWGGSGGGGRVAVVTNFLSLIAGVNQLTSPMVFVAGGARNNTNNGSLNVQQGQPGTFYFSFNNGGVVIKKTLTPVLRTHSDNSTSTNFNPYALASWTDVSGAVTGAVDGLIGDTIQVNLEVDNVEPAQTVTITDEILHLPQNASLVAAQKRYCKYVAGTVSSYGGIVGAFSAPGEVGTMTWVNITSSGDLITLNYQCKISLTQ